MPYRNMSLEDFAAYVGMDARDVRRLADRGKLPARKVGGQWRFNRARVTEWLQQEMPTLEPARLSTLDRTMRDDDVDASAPCDLVITPMIGIEGIDVALGANTRASVLRELVNLADRTGLLYDAAGLLEALEEREAMGSTAMPNGVALPHPRLPMPYVSAEPLICVARLPRGNPFGSPCGGLTRIFFLVCCHDHRHHLRSLARLMRILDDEMVAALMDFETPADLLEGLIAKETEVSLATA